MRESGVISVAAALAILSVGSTAAVAQNEQQVGRVGPSRSGYARIVVPPGPHKGRLPTVSAGAIAKAIATPDTAPTGALYIAPTSSDGVAYVPAPRRSPEPNAGPRHLEDALYDEAGRRADRRTGNRRCPDSGDQRAVSRRRQNDGQVRCGLVRLHRRADLQGRILPDGRALHPQFRHGRRRIC